MTLKYGQCARCVELAAEVAELRRAQCEPVAYRWRQPGNKHWIYDPTLEWIEDHKHEIELEPLYTLTPADGGGK